MSKWKIVILFLVSAGICAYNWEFCFPDFLKEPQASKITGFMPCKDRKRLDYFFRRLMFWDSCSYVLMGSKPCSIAVFEEPSHFSSFMPSNLRLWLGWRTWKKYEKYFPHPRFSIIKEKTENGRSLLIFINNMAFINVISSHKNDFEKTLRKSIEPNKILSEAETTPLFSGVFQNNDFLIGILLGFGRENSWLYYSNHQLSKNSTQMISFTAPEENERFLNYIRSHGIWGCASGALFSDFSKIQMPGCVVDPHSSETIELRKKYSAARQKIIEYYDTKNFLDATLELLTQSP